MTQKDKRNIYMSFIDSFLKLFGVSKPNLSYPSIIRDQCEATFESARNKINGRGYSLPKVASCKVVLCRGEKKFNGKWAGQIEGNWAHGYYDGSKVVIYCNPENKAEISVGTLEHEFAHYWLVNNMGNWTHDRLFDDLFSGWRDSRRITGRSTSHIFHVDFFKEDC